MFAYAATLGFDFRDTVDRLRTGNGSWNELVRLFDPIKGKRLFRTNVAIGAGSLIAFLVGAGVAIIWLLAMPPRP